MIYAESDVRQHLEKVFDGCFVSFLRRSHHGIKEENPGWSLVIEKITNKKTEIYTEIYIPFTYFEQITDLIRYVETFLLKSHPEYFI